MIFILNKTLSKFKIECYHLFDFFFFKGQAIKKFYRGSIYP